MIIASRELTLRDGAKAVKIPINIFAPEKATDGAWFCRYEVGWPDKKSSLSVGGYDSVQAMVSALQIIGAEIYSSSYHKSGKLFWENPGDGYGFPVASTLRDLLQGADAKYF